MLRLFFTRRPSEYRQSCPNFQIKSNPVFFLLFLESTIIPTLAVLALFVEPSQKNSMMWVLISSVLHKFTYPYIILYRLLLSFSSRRTIIPINRYPAAQPRTQTRHLPLRLLYLHIYLSHPPHLPLDRNQPPLPSPSLSR